MLVGLLAVSLAWSGAGRRAKAGERVKLTMFMGNSGLAQPAGVDPSDNWAINIVENYANVDLELEIPNYQDFPTKMNLLLASGNLPDVVHSWQLADMIKAADAGAFLDLKAFWDKSPQMQKVFPALNMELVKDQTTTGKYWAIPMNQHRPGSRARGVLVRQDLIDKYNGGKYPEDVQGYLNWFKAIKAAIPDSIPYRRPPLPQLPLLELGQHLRHARRLLPRELLLEERQVRGAAIELPEYKEAVKIYRQMYKDGILDKEFATNPRDAYFQKLANKFVATQTNTIDQIVPTVGNQLERHGEEQHPGVYWVYAPPLKRYPRGVRAEVHPVAELGRVPHQLGAPRGHQRQDQVPDRGLEGPGGLRLRRARDAQAWGREGKEYNVVGGKRVAHEPAVLQRHQRSRLPLLDPAPRHHLGLLAHGGEVRGPEAKAPGSSRRSTRAPAGSCRTAKATGIAPANYLPTFPDISAKSAEALALSAQIVAKTITGEMSLEDYDAAVKDWKQKYDFMLETQNKWISRQQGRPQDQGSQDLRPVMSLA